MKTKISLNLFKIIITCFITGTIITITSNANAQIIYTDISDTTIKAPATNNDSTNYYNLDLNNDGITDNKNKKIIL